MMSEATRWLTSDHVTAWCEKQSKLRSMTADEYASQVKDLIEGAAEYLPPEQGDKVLIDAFNLLRERLDIKIESKLVRGAQ